MPRVALRWVENNSILKPDVGVCVAGGGASDAGLLASEQRRLGAVFVGGGQMEGFDWSR